MRIVLAIVLALVSAVAAAAGCPPDCGNFRLGIETTLTLDDGQLAQDQRATLSHDFDARDLLGSGGSFRVGLSQPFSISDPGSGNTSLDVSLLWQPSSAFSPAALQVQMPVRAIDDYLHGDPDAGGRPSLRFILPRPIRWTWAPQPFIGGGDRELRAGLIFNFLSANGTPPGASNFSIDSVRVDYQFAAVPEPASWALWIAGLGLAGQLIRRQRKLARASATA